MEGGDQNGAANGGSRWNPTKDQINMLEGLYKQGLRTPTAQQIQQITARLRDFGHIEGKNVFYWFQNHKARQRQKHKQIKHDHFTYFNRFTHPTTPVFPPFQNVVCSPYYSADRPTGFYQQYPKVQPHTTGGGGGNSCNILMKRSSGVVIPAADETRYNKPMHEYYPRRQSRQHLETLDLFPIHPTGVLQLQAKHGGNVIENKKSNLTSSSSEIYNDQLALAPHEKAGKDNHFFDFFSCQN